MSNVYVATMIIPSIPFLCLVIFALSLTISLVKNFCFGMNSSKFSSLTLLQKSTLFTACFTFASIAMFGSAQIIYYSLQNTFCTNYDKVNTFMDVRYIPGLPSPHSFGSYLSLFNTSWSLTISFLCLWWISFYIFGLLRLMATFKDSRYALSKIWINIYIIILLFTVISISVIFTLQKLEIIEMWSSIWLQILFGIPCMFSGIHLIFQFNRKLFQLIFDNEEKEFSSSHSPDSDKQLVGLNESQITKISIATKQTILGNWVAISGLLFMIYFVLRQTIETFYIELKGDALWYCTVNDGFRVLFFMSLTYPIFIGFSAYKKFYMFCCNYPDKKLRGICKKKAWMKLNNTKEYIEMKRTVDSELRAELTKTITDDLLVSVV